MTNRILLALLLASSFLVSCAPESEVPEAGRPEAESPEAESPEAGEIPEASVRPKNIIFMIGDGMGHSQVKAYRYYANDPATEVIDPLPLDAYLTGAVATEAIAMDCAEDDATQCVLNPYGITDSASSASAYSTGKDTLVGRLGVSLEGERQESISEQARRQGIAIGIVSTSQVTHATPAAFYAHAKNRDENDTIADQLFDNQWEGMPLPQVILGGGTAVLKREDRDITAEFQAKGYSLVSNREELASNGSGLVLGLFAPIAMPRAWDRPDSMPTLADMTTAAIKVLEQDEEGFFLMVEGSQIDWASHSNDVAGVISEMQDFSAAIETAIAYAEQQGNTLVVVTADHETGGLSLGRDDQYFWNPRPIRGLKKTPAGITEEFLAGDEPLSVVAARHLPFELTEEERKALDEAKQETPPYPEYGVDGTQAYTLLNLLFDKRTQTEWGSMGHTGVDVPLYAIGPGSERFRGVLENEVVGQLLHELLLGSWADSE